MWGVALYYIMSYIKAIKGATPHYIFHKAIIKVTDIVSDILPESIKGWKVDRKKLAKILVKATISTGYLARIGENAGIADQDSISYQLRNIFKQIKLFLEEHRIMININNINVITPNNYSTIFIKHNDNIKDNTSNHLNKFKTF